MVACYRESEGMRAVLALFVLVGMVASGASAPGCSRPGVVTITDSAPPAIAAGDFTALIRVDGCGAQSQVQEGYAYCRMTEGPIGNQAVTFIAPPQAIKCLHAPCVDFTIFFPNQSPSYSDSIPEGQSSKSVPWTKLMGKTTFDPNDTGFWLYTYTIRWMDQAGLERKTVSDGEIRLRVVRSQVCDANGAHCSAYVPLRTAPDDPNFAWT